VPLDSNPNSNKKNIFQTLTQIKAFFSTFIKNLTYSVTKKYEVLRAIANALSNKLYTLPFYLYSNRYILRTGGFKTRHGFADGKSAILLVVYVVVAFLVATILFPIAMQQVTSAVTTSWNGAVSTVYVVLLPILVIIALALHFLGAI
jgi:hypothetical protein